MTSHISVVVGEVGEYSDQRKWLVAAFADYSDAIVYATRVSAQTKEVMAAYEAACEACYEDSDNQWPDAKDYIPALDPDMEPDCVEYYANDYNEFRYTVHTTRLHQGVPA
jgi:hypothetical protein